MSVVDPSTLIETRINDEVAPLRALLDESTDRRERRAIEREMMRREREIRKALSGNSIAW